MSLKLINIVESRLHRTDPCRTLHGQSVHLLVPSARPWGRSLWGTVSVTVVLAERNQFIFLHPGDRRQCEVQCVGTRRRACSNAGAVMHNLQFAN